MSVGDLKYKIFLFKDFSIVKTAIKDNNKRAVKSVALFLAFFHQFIRLIPHCLYFGSNKQSFFEL